MVKVTYNYKLRNGFLETETVTYNDMRYAFAFIRSLAYRNDVVGKPILERI